MNVSMTPSMAVNLCPILSNEAINAEYRLMTVAAPAIALTAKPGQFFHLKCPTAAGQAPYLRRPMSIYDIDRGNGRLSFLYKVQGTGTRALADLRPAVDAFFDKVTVNDPDPALRANRLRLLNQLREATRAVADFGLID